MSISNYEHKDTKTEIIISAAFSFTSILVGVFLVLQSRFDFWLSKPIGFFFLCFPIILLLSFIRQQYQYEKERGIFLDCVLTANPNVIFIYDWKKRSTKILNDGFPSLGYDYNEIVKFQDDLFHVLADPADLQSIIGHFNEVVASGDNRILTCEWQLKNKSGEKHSFRVQQTKLKFSQEDQYIIGFAEDITKERDMEESLQKDRIRISQMEKYTAIKNLGSGVSHEIANPLAAILGRVQLLRMQIKSGTPDYGQFDKSLETVETNVSKIRKTLQALKLMTRDDSNEVIEPVSVSQIFEDVKAVWGQRLLNHNFGFEVQEVDKNIKINCRKSQMLTALFNMISNSFETLTETESKWIKVESQIDAKEIVISVTDSGNGVPVGMRNHIFDAAFSKGKGVWAGLGLSIARDLVRAYGGDLTLDEASANTRFMIRLPMVAVETKVSA